MVIFSNVRIVLLDVKEFTGITDQDIESGRATDAYFLRTEEALVEHGSNPEVVAEVTADQLPTGEFEVFAGVEDVAQLLSGKDVDVYALPEGQLFDGGPVLRIEGQYLDFARFETSLLGFLSHQSAMATHALNASMAAEDVPVLSFGSRHVHPRLATALERSALIGGVDGISHVAAADHLNKEASGTMPHALMLSVGQAQQEEVWESFANGVGDDVPCIILADTFTDEVDEVRRAVETLGSRLDGVRLDTTSSRRGDFKQIIREVRWELEELGREDVDILVSGGIGVETIRELKELVDGFGVGSFISNADPVDFGLDIVKRDGTLVSKRGKFSDVKEVYRDGGEHVVQRASKQPPNKEADALLEPLIKHGEIVRDFGVESAADLARTDAQTVSDFQLTQKNK